MFSIIRRPAIDAGDDITVAEIAEQIQRCVVLEGRDVYRFNGPSSGHLRLWS